MKTVNTLVYAVRSITGKSPPTQQAYPAFFLHSADFSGSHFGKLQQHFALMMSQRMMLRKMPRMKHPPLQLIRYFHWRFPFASFEGGGQRRQVRDRICRRYRRYRDFALLQLSRFFGFDPRSVDPRTLLLNAKIKRGCSARCVRGSQRFLSSEPLKNLRARVEQGLVRARG